jgi:hypothetical protein
MKEISSALVKAQKEFSPALKTSTNPHFKSKYADLSACVEAVMDALNNNGIMLMQQTHLCENGVIIETMFIHESGEQLSGGKLHVPSTKHDAQGYGSAMSYARRYSLMAACGIAPEDDDGNAASKTKTPAPIIPASPKTDTLGLTDSELSHITDMAQAIKELVASGDAEVALDTVLEAKLEEPQRLALNNMLDSKTRSALKAENEARKAKK